MEDEEQLEPGHERLARLFGAAFWSGFTGYVLGLAANEDGTIAPFLVQTAVVPVVTLLFCLPRCAYASYLGRGFAAAGAFALGYASGMDYEAIDPQREITPGLTFILGWFFSYVMVLAGLLPLGLLRLFMWSTTDDNRGD